MKLLKYTILFTIFFASTIRQESDIPKLWKEVAALEDKGLTKSALEKVKEIKSMAKLKNLKAESIKALLYQSKYILILEENAQLNIVNEFKSEIEQHQSPAKNVLQGYLANLYWQYFQKNRFQFYNRTQTESKVDSTDFRTWDLNTLFSEIDLHFKNSLENPEALQSTSISTYNILMDEKENSKLYRPTLYDILAHNALSFYRTDEGAITRPSYKFIIDKAAYIDISKDFSELNIDSKDSTSLELKALNIYQELIKFHQRENNLKALIDVDIQRLHFVRQNAIIDNKTELFILTLNKSKEEYGNTEDTALYDYEIARVYSELGYTYNPDNNPKHQFKLKEAIEICNQVISKFPNSLAAEKCAVLKQQILNPNLVITTEENIPLNTVSKVLIRYKNVDQLSFKVHKVTIDQIRRLSRLYRQDQQLNFIENLEVLEQFSSDLISEEDYQIHSVEKTIPALPNGHYIITAQSSDGNIKSFTTSQITNFGLVEKNSQDSYVFQLINRLNGEPIPNVNISFSHRTNSSENYFNKGFITDDKGQFVIDKSGNTYRDIKILANKDGQEGYFEDFYISRNYNEQNYRDKNNYNAFVFTDRSIYRPGQTVYFKGIVINTQDNNSKVVANEKVKAELMDVNHQNVSEVYLVTNEFGSVSGEFILPSSGLNGEYHIELKGDKINFESQQYFSVEEYKRPKFKVELLPITKSYKVNDSIIVQGEALAFAGSSISDAIVKYRVHRKVQMPQWYYWSRPAYNSESQEIAYGNTTTDADGKFNIPFKAIPDESVDQKNLPIFNYEVSVEVTDINGETREANKTVNVGYQDVVPSIVMPDKIDKVEKGLRVSLETNNLNDEFVPATGTLKIYKLIAPDRVLRSRPWGTPDYKSLSKEEFLKLFPNESYEGEDEVFNWEKGQQVVSNTFNTKDSKVVDINPNDFEAGTYMAVMEVDDSNTDTSANGVIKDEKIFKVFNRKAKRVADNDLFEIFLDKDSYQANQQVEVTIGSAAKNLTVTIDIEKDQKVVNTYILELNNERKSIKIPVNKEDLGGFAVLYSYAFQNSFKSASLMVPVPYPSSELSIETSTFRDKLKPGTDETWEFMVKGPKGEAVSAELLAGMYDKSLDQFKAHDWTFNPLQQPQYHTSNIRQAYKSFAIKNYRLIQVDREFIETTPQSYDSFKWFGLNFGNGNRRYMRTSINALVMEEAEMDVQMAPQALMKNTVMDEDLEEVVVAGYSVAKEKQDAGQDLSEEIDNISIRKNLQETAFFFPQLKTDKDGNIKFGFTSPEALTSWKLQLLAHDKQLNSSIKTLETVTQKELMVLPNVPRFLRQGDKIVLSSKISNLSEITLSGWAQIQLTDALTGKALTADLLTTGNKDQATDKMNFTVDANGNTQVSWTLTIPDNLQALEYKIVAKAGDFSDGEQSVLPVLTNRKLVTETLPMWVKSNESRTFVLDKLSTNTSSTLKHHKLSLEVTSNPAWLAVQSLPYLMEFPYECNEQVFSRVYANSLASYIAHSNPRIKSVFDQWASSDALISNLEKNEELKSIILTETPWIRDAKSETEQKKRIGLLFDINKMSNELKIASRKLANNQMENGAWAWFKGGLPNRYITQHIVTGFGHLSILKKGSKGDFKLNESEIRNALDYLDKAFVKEYKDLKKYNKDVDLSKDHLSYTQLHYLYMRSFYEDVPKTKEVENIIEYYHGQIKKYWLSRNLYSKGLMALVTHRLNDTKTANTIMKSLKENSIIDEEMGMYWKENTSSWHWYQAPIETQALMIEAFSEIEKDTETIDNLKIWLLKHKQTNSWKTTKATTDASYALLLQGSDWLSVSESVDIVLGDKSIKPETMEEVKVEAGTGYFKTTWEAAEITPKMAEVTMEKKNAGIAWGALYWQYFEDLDKITSAETPLQLKKKLFKRTYSDKGEFLQEIAENKGLKIGDLLRVRIELRVDRDMEFIHMKDMRAAGLEPINVLSTYKWQDGLGYYESTKDASTDFFFDYLPKGVYVFEYDLRVNNAGEMSNGITTIQSMYAPEFSSHSEGVRIVVGSR